MVKFWPHRKKGKAPVNQVQQEQQEQQEEKTLPIRSLCTACQNITFHPMRSMTPERWSEYFPFLVDRPDLADEYSKRLASFLQQLPEGDTYEAILQLNYASLEANAESETCSFCHFLCQLLQGCYRSEPSKPGSSPYGPPEDDLDELRSCSPVVWLEATVKEPDTNGLSLEDALADAVVVLKMANTLVYPRFLMNDVHRREQTTEEQNSAQNAPISDSHTGSKPNLELAKNWLSTCRSQHLQCRQQDDVQQGLPSRLLDLKIPGWQDDLVLRMTSDLVKSDCEVGGENGYAYASLSHRWGENQPVTTTTANIERHLSRIKFAELPKTFQQAIEFARELDIRYLWIDCLCILQDSTVDKGKEIPKMVEIYNNAMFNIAACAAQDSSAGLFFTRAAENVHPQRLPLTFRTEDGNNHEVLATLSPMIRNNAESSGRIDNVLEGRGWIFQERAFSKRVFSFEKKLLWFECREMIASENLSQGGQRHAGDSDTRQKWDDLLPEVGNRDLSDLSYHLFHALELKDKKGEMYNEHVKSLYRDWYAAVPTYLSRTFSFETDRLPGISGLASRIQVATGDEYLAGIWKSQIIQGLCWSVTGGGKPSKRFNKNRRAPSWSWAAMKGPTKIQYGTNVGAEPQLEVLDAWTRADGENPFGDAGAGELRVRGRMKPAQAWCTMSGSVSEEQFHVASLFDTSIDLEKEKFWYVRGGSAQAYMDRIKDYTFGHCPVWVLPVIAYWPILGGQKKGKKVSALVLRDRGDGTFSREGFCWRLSKGTYYDWDDSDEDGEDSWFAKGSELREITIV